MQMMVFKELEQALRVLKGCSDPCRQKGTANYRYTTYS